MPSIKTRAAKTKAALLVLLFMLLLSPNYATQAVHAAWQTAYSVSLRRHYLAWPSLETTYFHLRYAESDRVVAAVLGEQADEAVRQVALLLPHAVGQKRPWLIVIPDQQTMKRAFGWGDETGALGVYLVDTIKILTPAAWDWYEEHERWDVFARQGPLVHEYTHFVLDLRTKGNYTRWFSEGLSQLTEYHILGFEWLEAGSSLSNTLYSLDQLDESFDQLSRQELAYRQALSMVTYLETLQGLDGLNQLLDTLAEGVPFYHALEDVYGLDRESFWQGWVDWHRSDARWFQSKQRK